MSCDSQGPFCVIGDMKTNPHDPACGCRTWWHHKGGPEADRTLCLHEVVCVSHEILIALKKREAA